MTWRSPSIADQAPVRLMLEAKAENAALARRAVADEAARAGLAERVAAAAQVVVTESFTNATRHAHPRSASGRVQVEVEGDEDGITIVVRDSGGGFRPRVPEESQWNGFGLSLIAALADRVEFRRLDEGTEVRARLDAARPPRSERERMH